MRTAPGLEAITPDIFETTTPATARSTGVLLRDLYGNKIYLNQG